MIYEIDHKYQQHADAEYLTNVSKFLRVGEGRELDKFETSKIKQKFRTVEHWYASLTDNGRWRIDNYLIQTMKKIG